MSSNFRARRPASPPPGMSHPAPVPQPQRFPHPREDHLDADARRAAASRGVAPGRTRHYPSGGLNLASGEWKLLVVIILIACTVRLYRLSKPNSVVFDEVHFGKFASKYIKTQYFVDVHPPLAKLLITLAGFMFGYDGVFDFKEIGKTYENVPYVAMRMLPAMLGVATVPLAYLTLRALECRATTALLASLFITFENGLVTQSRHILLDAPLVFFTALTTFFWIGFCNEDKHRPFTPSWWSWLTLSGLSLGAVFSCKWVGLFTIATVGCSTLVQLWNLLGDLRVTPRLFMRHFLARALCLIIVPMWFYMFMFQIHFLILQNSGDGDGFMSSEFQHTLGGRGMADTYADVAIGSSVTLRHVNTQGGYLHSHPHNYPGGSKQQQITLYPHRDANNDWQIFNATDLTFDIYKNELAYITTGSRIKLRHISTQKHIHSHDFRPPVSDVDFQNEVSAYGMPGFDGDVNDDFIVEIESGDSRDKESSKRVRTLRTKFRLRHMMTGCYLFSHKVKLPDWGYEQQEVTCNKNAVKINSLWYIETASHPALGPNAERVNYQTPSFLAKFWELQKVMWTTNAGLTDRHTFDSRPDSWPRLRRGINFWVKDHQQIYLIGNPLVWYLSTAAVAAYAVARGFLILRAKRGFRDFEDTRVVKYDALCGFLFVGWALHYFPFFLMARQLFLHHYFPALYFAILLSCGVFDLLTSSLRARTRLQIAAVLIILAVWNFQHLSPLAYGTPWTKAKCHSSKWLKTWDFSCNDFYDSYEQYSPAQSSTAKTTSPAMVTQVGGEAAGRGAVVVEDKIQNIIPVDDNHHPGQVNEAGIPVANPDTTLAVHGKAEPGRDIFEEKMPKDIKSDGVARPPVQELNEEEVQKEISSVGAGSAQSTQNAVKDAQDVGAVGAAEHRVDSTQTQASSDSNEKESSDSTVAAKKPAGPMDEVENEAQKAAEELYPDAA